MPQVGRIFSCELVPLLTDLSLYRGCFVRIEPETSRNHVNLLSEALVDGDKISTVAPVEVDRL